MHLSPWWLRLLSVLRRWFCCCLLFVYCYSHSGSLSLFYVLLYITLCPFYYCNHLDGEERVVVLLNLSSWCLVMVERLFLAVPWGCLRFVIMVFSDHTQLLFIIVSHLRSQRKYSKTCLERPLYKDRKLVFNTNYCLLLLGTFCNTFDVH